MIIVWLLLMGLFIAYLAVPMSRWLGWEYGRFGRVGDNLLIVGGTLVGGVVLVSIVGLIGQFTIGDAGALGLGFAGALIVLGLLILFSNASVDDQPEDIPPTPPIDEATLHLHAEDKARPVQSPE
jgi:hypothetical protein